MKTTKSEWADSPWYGRSKVGWVGASVETQEQDERIIDLLRIPATRRFLSLEPLLGEMDISSAFGENHGCGGERAMDGCAECGWLARPVDWVIVGGESGPRARPCYVEWVRGIIAQCRAAKVPCFVKQLGSNCVSLDDDFPCAMTDIGKEGVLWKAHFKHANGGDPAEWPEDLRVREMPQ